MSWKIIFEEVGVANINREIRCRRLRILAKDMRTMKNAICFTLFAYLSSLKFKLGANTAEVERNINLTFEERTANKQPIQQWVQKYCSRDENIQNEHQERTRNI